MLDSRGKTLYFLASTPHAACSCWSLSGLLSRWMFGWLTWYSSPFEVVGIGLEPGVDPRQAKRRRARHPAILVDRPVAHHLEILGAVPGWRRGIVEGVDGARAVQRLLLHPVEHIRRRD